MSTKKLIKHFCFLALPFSCDCYAQWLKEPGQMCGPNIYSMAAVICAKPAFLKGRSFFNETLPKDLIC